VLVLVALAGLGLVVRSWSSRGAVELSEGSDSRPEVVQARPPAPVPREDYTFDEVAALLRRQASRVRFEDDVLEVGRRRLRVCYSIDTSLQREAGELLRRYHPRYGAIAMVESHTGRVLLLSSFVNEGEPFLGRNLYCRSFFPAASVFKIVTAAAAIERGRLLPSSELRQAGRNHTLYSFQLDSTLSSYRTITLADAFAYSINPVFGRLGIYVLGREGLAEYSERFGFGEPIPFEFDIDSSTVGAFDSTFGMAEVASGFNQDTRMSPLFGALLGAAVAEEGVMMAPRVVDSLIDIRDSRRVFTAETRPWRLAVQRALEPQGRLIRSRLVFVGDEDFDPLARSVSSSPRLLRDLVTQRGGKKLGPFEVETEVELRKPLMNLVRLVRKRAEVVADVQQGFASESRLAVASALLDETVRQLDEVLERRSAWTLSRLRAEVVGSAGDRGQSAWVMLLVLVGKHLRTFRARARAELCKGSGLAQAACRGPDDYAATLSLLQSEGALVKEGLVQPCGGAAAGLFMQDWGSIETTEFELTARAVAELGYDRQAPAAAVDRAPDLIEPRLKLSDVVLDGATARAMELATAHARNAGVLLGTWGLGRVLPWGRGVTLLFWGPPGTGKTATAEALAGELGCALLVADYSAIENCYVGQTEKNIVATFARARQSRALLFWDEADAILADRDEASRSWEVSRVNVLLQELERFEGVCVLATNRRPALDGALERRISLKVEFARPGRDLRARLWRTLLPTEMPLAGDVDVEALAAWDLSGGGITNVIVNGARAALVRSGDHHPDRGDPRSAKSPVVAVALQDLEEAYRSERSSWWTSKGTATRGVIGFRRESSDS